MILNIILLCIYVTNASSAFEETKSIVSSDRNTICSKRTNQARSRVQLVNEIFAEPYLEIISKFLPFPQSKYCVINKFTRDHFQKGHFSCWNAIAQTLDITGIIPTYDLGWFDAVVPFKDDPKVLVPLLLHAVVEQERFPFNLKQVIELIFSKFYSLDRDSRRFIDFRFPWRNFLAFTMNLQDFNYSTPLPHDGPLFAALKSHSCQFEEMFNNILKNDSVDSLSDILTTFVARAIVSRIPVSHLLHVFASRRCFLVDVIGFANSIATDDDVPHVFTAELDIYNEIHGRNQEPSVVEYLTLLHDIRTGSRQVFDFQSRIEENDWDYMQIGAIAEAFVLADKTDAFNDLVLRYRFKIFRSFGNFLQYQTVSSKYFAHFLTLLSGNDMMNFSHSIRFQILCTEYYDIAAYSESFEKFLVTFTVKAEYAGSGYPATFVVSKSIYVFYRDESRKVYIEQIFKSPESFRRLAPQVQIHHEYLLPPVARLDEMRDISFENIKMICALEDVELRDFLLSKLYFDTRETLAVFDSGNPDDLALLRRIGCDTDAMLSKLSTRAHFETFEVFIGDSMASYLIPRMNDAVDNTDAFFYAKFRLALRYMKRQYPERFGEIANARLFELFSQEKFNS
jgi:hypothetical protein